MNATTQVSRNASESPATARVALLVRLEAKPGKEAQVARLLEGGLSFVREESATPYWFALQLGPTTFGIFDAFPDELARQAHLTGRLASALMAQAPDLLAEAPSIERVDVLATKDFWLSSPRAAIRYGLLARLQARPGKEREVASLLAAGVRIVEDEPGTPIWFGIQLAPGTFGIFDAFASEPARQAHLEGRLAQALMAQAPDLLAVPPSIEPVDVLASKLPR